MLKNSLKGKFNKETKNILCSCQSTPKGIEVEIPNILEEVKARK